MLSSVLNSEQAVQVNIEIMRAFVRLRQLLASNAELARKLAALEKKYDAQFRVVFDAICQLMEPPEKTRRRIGFQVKEARAREIAVMGTDRARLQRGDREAKVNVGNNGFPKNLKTIAEVSP
jgi:hypothetical protein